MEEKLGYELEWQHFALISKYKKKTRWDLHAIILAGEIDTYENLLWLFLLRRIPIFCMPKSSSSWSTYEEENQ